MALGLSVAPSVAQGPATNSVAAAIENAKRAQQTAEAKRAATERAAKAKRVATERAAQARAQQRARVEAEQKEYERNQLAARQSAIRRAEEERRNEKAREEAAQALRDARDAARRQALLEAQQRAEELRRIAQLNADNLRTDLEQKARAGDAQAALRLARIYETGDGVSLSAMTASSWLKMAAELGEPAAQLKYVKAVASDLSVGTDPLVMKYLMSLSAQNNPEAQYILSQRYASAVGVPQDKAKALTLLKSAADAGYIQAQEVLGKALQDGSLGKKDYPLSISYLQMADNRGSKLANFNLGFAYEYGLGVKKNHDTAFRYYTAAFETNRRPGMLERMAAVDPFGYPGKQYGDYRSSKLSMTCPRINLTVSVNNGVIYETFKGSQSEWPKFVKQDGRNVFKYFATIADFDNKRVVLKLIGKTVLICE